MTSDTAVCCAVIAMIGRQSLSVLAFIGGAAAVVQRSSTSLSRLFYRKRRATSSRWKIAPSCSKKDADGGRMELKRSWMFVPGHRQKMVDKALGLNADAIMLDIEDGVAPNEKDTARRQIAEALGRERTAKSPARFVRINAIGYARMKADLEAVVRPGLDGLVLPKVETADEVRQVESLL